MSWLFSRALVAEYSAANSLDGAPFAPSSGTPTPQAYLWRDKTMDAWNRFPSGMTSAPLTDDRGEALLKWYREDFLAPTSALPDEEQESTDRQAPCGSTWRELSVRFDRNSSSWKTVQCLFDEDLPESSLTLPRWGMMRGGELWERTMSALPTGETEFGLLPTVLQSDATGTGRNRYVGSQAYRGGKAIEGLRTSPTDPQYIHPDFAEWMIGWPIAWSALEPLETPKFRQWCDSHGICLEDQSDET